MRYNIKLEQTKKNVQFQLFYKLNNITQRKDPAQAHQRPHRAHQALQVPPGVPPEGQDQRDQEEGGQGERHQGVPEEDAGPAKAPALRQEPRRRAGARLSHPVQVHCLS